jgi:hypothetical protein
VRALKATRLAGLRRRDGGHDHVSQLGGEQAGARADEGEGHLEARVVQCHVERGEHHDRADADPHQPDLRDGARRAPRRDPRAQQREDEHGHRQREQALAGLERVEAQDDLQVDGDDEERAHEDELLPEQRREPRAQPRDAQQRRIEQLVASQAGTPLFPRGERPQQGQAAEHHERHRREAQRGDLCAVDRRRRARLNEPPHAAAQDREHDETQAARRQRTPTTSSCGRRSGPGARAICPRRSRIAITTTVSPANT